MTRSSRDCCRAFAFLALAPLLVQAAAPIPGYLFAHVTKEDYGRLHYSLSTNGLHWKKLNGGRRILGQEYWGHPDICRGHDGRFYLAGNIVPNRDLSVWVSSNLVGWSKFAEHRIDVTKVPGCAINADDHGAPKIYFDSPSATYYITWHTSVRPKSREDPELFWSGQRTLFIASRNLKDFSEPKRLFPFEIATIDVILRREGARYYAFLKDERMPSFEWPTGKSIRVVSAPSLEGPWSAPSTRITPNFREAPTLIPKPDEDGWYLYYEQYPAVAYGVCTAPTLEGPWHELYWQNYSVPSNARHGCMIPLTRDELTAVRDAYDN